MKDQKTSYLITDQFIKALIHQVIKPIVQDVRLTLLCSYNVSKGEYRNYRGLCDVATKMVLDRINEYMKAHFNYMNFETITKHGEQRHCPEILSTNWVYQHTWGCLRVGTREIYIDPTCGQFNDIWDDALPDFYISEEPPRWFYDDRKNPAFNGITRKINELIKIPLYLEDGKDSRWVKEGIIEFMQYGIWGYISDKIYRSNNKGQEGRR